MTRDPDTPREPRPRRRKRRAALFLVAFMAFVAAAAAGGSFWLKGRELMAPDWVRAQIEMRIGDALPEARVSFGDIVVVLDEGWRPRASVRNVRVATHEDQEIVAFSDVRASVAMRPLLKGQLDLKSVDVSGVFLTLRRSGEGAIALSGTAPRTEGVRVSRQAPNLAQLVTEMGDILLRPGVENLVRVTVSGLTLRYEDQRAERAWTIDGGRLRLERDDDRLQIAADLAVLGGGAQVATLAATYSGQIGAKAAEFGVTINDLDAGDVASQGPAFAWLAALRAPISGALRGGVNEDGTFDPLNATFQIGAGVIQPTPESRAVPIDSAQSYFSYLPQEKVLRFDELSVVSKWGSGRLEGRASIGLNGNGRPGDLVGQLRLSDLEVNPAEFYPAPVSVAAAELDFRLRLKPFALDVGRLQVEDQGEVLTASGTLGADSRGWNIAMDAQMGALNPARLLELWPARIKPKSRKWISENIKAGAMQNITGALRLRPGEKPETALGFDFTGGEARFLKTMPHLKNAAGHATLFGNRFVVVADEGVVEAPDGGLVDVTGTSFIIPDVRIKDFTPGVVRLNASGGVVAALSLLDLPPLEVMKKAGRSPRIATGRAAVNGTISLPLEKKVPLELVKYDLTGTITDVRSDVLVPDRVLRAASLDLVASDALVTLTGQGDLDGVPFDVVWRQPLGEEAANGSTVTGIVRVTPDALDAFRITLPDGMLSGETVADVDIRIVKDQPPELTLTSDLRGMAFSVSPVGWRKASGTAGLFALNAVLKPTPEIRSLSLEAPGLVAEGDVLLREDKSLDRVRLSRVRVGGWLNVQVDLVGRGAGLPPAVTVNGGNLDLRRAEFGQTRPGTEPVTPLNVRLDTLQISDQIAISGLRGEFTTGGEGLSGRFTGAVNAGAQVVGQVIPRGVRSAIRVTADDAGQAVASAGVLKQGRGGQLELILLPVGTGGAFDGNLRVVDISVVDAPAIAALLNAVSIVGLVNEIGGDGIYFSEVTADFRLSPSQITLREASAVGSSMGLSMDGVFVPDTGQLQMQGVISPVYLLNGIGSIFTRKGEGLFGFNYSIRGTTSDPKVSVNPLTAFTPGGIRDLFRGPKPDVPLAEGEEPPPPPEPRRRPVVVSGEDR